MLANAWIYLYSPAGDDPSSACAGVQAHAARISMI